MRNKHTRIFRKMLERKIDLSNLVMVKSMIEELDDQIDFERMWDIGESKFLLAKNFKIGTMGDNVITGELLDDLHYSIDFSFFDFRNDVNILEGYSVTIWSDSGDRVIFIYRYEEQTRPKYKIFMVQYASSYQFSEFVETIALVSQ